MGRAGFRVGDSEINAVFLKPQFHSAGALGGNGGHPVNRAGEFGLVHFQCLVIARGDHSLIIGERAFNQLGCEHNLPDFQLNLGI